MLCACAPWIKKKVEHILHCALLGILLSPQCCQFPPQSFLSLWLLASFTFISPPYLSHFYSPLSPHGMRPIPRHPSVPCCLRKSPIDGPGLGGPARHTKKDKSKQFARLEVVGLFLQGEISPPQLQNGAFPPSAEIFRRAVALRGRYPRGHAPCPALSTRQASAAPTIPRV